MYCNIYFKQLKYDGELVDFIETFENKLEKEVISLLNGCYFDVIENKDLYGELVFFRSTNCKLFYWKEHKLVGVVKDLYKLDTTSLIDCAIEFQDNTDADYDLDIWSDSIDLFRHIKYDTVKRVSEEILRELYDLCDNEDVDYYRRTFMYDLILKKLEIDKYMLDKEVKFKIIGLSLNSSSYEKMKIIARIKKKIFGKDTM